MSLYFIIYIFIYKNHQSQSLWKEKGACRRSHQENGAWCLSLNNKFELRLWP